MINQSPVNTKKYYYLQNLCERRALDSERLHQYFKKNKIKKIKKIKEADYVVFFACGMLEENSYKIVERISKKIHSESKILVFGCFPSMCSEKNYGKNIYYIPLRKPELINQIIKANVDILKIQRPHFTNKNIKFSETLKEWDPRLSMPYCKDVYSLIISNGCSEKCSYCTIRYATGPLKSDSVENIVNHLKNGLSKGYKIFRFQCENLGVYGLDINENIGTLLDALLTVKENYTIDLPDFHPRGFVNHFQKIMEFIKKKDVCLLHLPVQSANQRVLNLMNREYDIKDVDKKMKEFKRLFPKMKIGTDIIAGFPTETDKEFMDSFRFMGRHEFDWVYLHGYNEKENALVNKIKPKIDEEVIADRIKYSFNRIPNVACYLNNYMKTN